MDMRGHREITLPIKMAALLQEIVEYLVRVDLDRMGIDENQFEEMKVANMTHIQKTSRYNVPDIGSVKKLSKR